LEALDSAVEPIFPFLTDFVLRKISSSPGKITALDLGAGTGLWAKNLLAAGVKRVLVLDPDFYHLIHGHSKIPALSWQRSRFFAIQGRAEEIPFKNSSINLVVSRNSMHLWNNIPEGWREISRILAPGGTAFIGRGFGPSIDPDTRQMVKENRKRVSTGETPAKEPDSPLGEEALNFAAKAGLISAEVVPDTKSYWVLAKKPL